MKVFSKILTIVEEGSRSDLVSSYPEEEDHEECCVFGMNKMNRRIASMKVTKEVPVLVSNEEQYIGTSDVPYLKTFQISECHTDVTAYALSERWVISLAQATITLKKTTQKFLRIAVLPLASRYRTDRLFTRKTLQGQWSCDTMNGRCKSMDDKQYDQVFVNKDYFANYYSMDYKSKAGDALKLLCQEFGVPEKLTFDGSK